MERLRGQAKSKINLLKNCSMEEVIFKEIKKFRGQNTTISNCIDGEVGAKNIENHFQEIYENI